MTIAQKIEQMQVTLTTAAKNLERQGNNKRSPPRIDHPNIISKLVTLSLSKCNKEKLELKWESAYRIVGFPTKWTARVRNKESWKPKHCNIKDIKLKDPGEDWELRLKALGEQQNL